MTIRVLQNFIIKTDFGPFAWFYRKCYALAIKKITRTFKKHPEIASVYLIASMAAGDFVPGISDIDLIIIVKDGPGNKQKTQKCYSQLTGAVPFLKDNEQAIYTLEEINQCYVQSNFYLKYKIFIECKKQGKLLCGEDILSGFKELNSQQKNESVIGQLEFIWSIFLKNFLIRDNTKNLLYLNYFCYKLTSDMCKAILSAYDGKNIFKRKTALKLAFSYLNAKDQAHLATVTRLAERKFSDDLPHLLEDTYLFCISAILHTSQQIPGLPENNGDQEAQNSDNYDLSSLNFILTGTNQRKVETFISMIKEKYNEYISSVLLSPFDIFHMSEENIGIFIIQKKILPLGIIKEFIAALEPQTCPQRLCLYITTPDMAISLNTFNASQMHCVITPLKWMTPTLIFLSTPAAALLGKPLPYQDSKKIVVNSFWNDPAIALVENEIAVRELMNSSAVSRASTIEFQHFFWQAIQVKIIKDSLNNKKIFIPLSSFQIYSCCPEIKNIPTPWLKEFYEEYKKQLEGIPSNAESYFPQAMAILRNLYPTEE